MADPFPLGKENDEIAQGHYMEICPHEKLHFSTLQEMVHLPGFKPPKFKRVDGLSCTSSPNHGMFNLTDDGAKCYCIIGNPSSTILGVGNFTFGYAGFGEIFPGPHRGVVLRTNWCFYLEKLTQDIDTVEGVERLLANDPIYLCPHKQLIEFATPQRMLTSIQTCQQEMDPIQKYKLTDSLNTKEVCGHCHTYFYFRLFKDDKQCKVFSIRLLGRAKTPDDPVWLSQYVGF